MNESIFAEMESRLPITHLSKSFYVSNDKLVCYVRLGHKYVDRQKVTAFTIANVNIPPESRRNGVYSQFLIDAEQFCKHHQLSVLFIENVLYPLQYEMYDKRGFTFTEDCGGVRSYYKLIA